MSGRPTFRPWQRREVPVNEAVLEGASRPAGGDCGSVAAELVFITPSDTKPVFQSAAYTGGEPRTFFKTERHGVAIQDVRPVAASLALDRQGFELHRQTSTVRDFYDDEEIKARYYPEIEAHLMRLLGANRVAIFDVTRRSDAGPGAKNPDGVRGPASRVHVDYTEKSGPQRVKDVLGEGEAARLARNGARIVQINVWRPIRGPVERSPLALADAASIKPQHLIATEQIFPDRVGEIYHLVYYPSQRWYYAPRMNTDEVLLIKGWDSLKDGRARFTPHAAFALPHTPRDAPPRESIEVRTLVVMEN